MSEPRDDPMRLWVGDWMPESIDPRVLKGKDRKDEERKETRSPAKQPAHAK